MRGAGRAGLGHTPTALQLHADPALENFCNFHRQRRAAGAAAHQRRQIALVQIRQARDRDPHRGNARKRRGALDLDVAHHALDVEALVQRDQMAAPQRRQQHHGQRVDMEQRQHADHALDRIAFGARPLAPDVVDRNRRGQIAVAEHRALGQSRGAAGILQQRDVVGADRGPLRGFRRAIGEFAPGDDFRIVRQRGLWRADLAPMIVLADDQAIDQTLVEEFQRGRQQRRKIGSYQYARAGIRKLVRQRNLAVERRQMHQPRAGLQRAEEIDRMIRRIAEEQRDGSILAIAGAQERRRGMLHHCFQLGIADGAVAEFDCRPRRIFKCSFRQQIRDRAARDLVVPADALRIELLAGMGHQSASFPPPLRGRVTVGGKPHAPDSRYPHPRPLPARGRGASWTTARREKLRIKPPSRPAPARQTSCLRRRGA